MVQRSRRSEHTYGNVFRHTAQHSYPTSTTSIVSKGLCLFSLPHTLLLVAANGCLNCLSFFPLVLRLSCTPSHQALSQTTGSSAAGRSMAFAAVQRFQSSAGFLFGGYQRETEVPLKSFFLSVMFTEEDRINAC